MRRTFLALLLTLLVGVGLAPATAQEAPEAPGAPAFLYVWAPIGTTVVVVR